ncbi:SH3 domain-containing protein [Bartonella ancashensis]|uniref:SH3b domain-containing protein n=2 Tax=Bartonella ancashensis TaxID=1318743 RepID=A0A0M4LSH6_9HYPH|nr:SH3 domain-containing protein [Bartonella ancashensis]ALE03384.1 hypothetical protein PU02_0570 [Bartonella ancashensis]
MRNFRWLRFLAPLLFTVVEGFLSPSLISSYAQTMSYSIGPSGLPLPRFASIKPNRVNVRVGPSSQYAVIFIYRKKGLPVEIIQEYDQWRKIRDAEGDEGWVYKSLLSGKRTVLTIPWRKNTAQNLVLRKSPDNNARPVAKIGPNIIGNIRKCNGQWCELDIHNIRGWLHQTQLWGIYPDEK